MATRVNTSRQRVTASPLAATVYHSLYATVAYPPSQNCIGSRVRIPQFDSAQKTQTGVVTGSKPTLAFTCYPPVPKPDASPHDPGMQFCDGVSFTLCHRCISGCLLSHEVAAWVSFARPLTHLCMAASNQRLEERGRFRPGGPTKSDTTRPGAVRAPLIASQRARALQTSPSRAAHAPRVRVTVAVSPKHLPQLKAISA